MKPLVIAAALLAALPAVARDDASNVLTAAEKKQGWKLLFDGKTTAGWRGYRKPDVPAGWKVENGALVLDGKGGDLVTAEQYGDFELALEWRIEEGGNSGIMYRVVEAEKAPPYFSGPEMQIADPKNVDGPHPMRRAGSCYDLYPVPRDVTRPGGQWNQARLVVRGPRVEHWLNGARVAAYEIGSADWEAKVAASKFAKWPQFGKAPRGHIDLQDHGNRVEFRNVKLRELTATR
jgi:hypothetical protein